MRLLDFASDVHSQTGEDGVIAKALEVIGDRDGWCVEFGAWDGEHLSNTKHLVDAAGYRAVLIEPDPARFRTLSRRIASNPKLIGVQRMVGFTAADGLDSILRGTPIPANFDFLSIDIDGNDIHAWAAVRDHAPKLVCIEFNPTIPTEVDFAQPADPAVTHGASLLAITKLATSKGYSLVACTAHNAFFVLDRYFPRFGIEDNSLRALREDCSEVTHLFCGFDGTIFLEGGGRMPWHDLRYRGMVRQLPRFLRRHPGRYGLAARASMVAYRWFVRTVRGG